MYLPGAEEWAGGSLGVDGTDVFCSANGKVSREWLSGCEEERALTRGMMERISEPTNLVAALRQVVKNGGSPGIDGMTTNELMDWFSGNMNTLRSSLLSGTYSPSPVREVEIEKPTGGYRN